MKKHKIFISFIIVFLLFCNSYAAIVTDNDGSAFVTKAEFEALKNGFNEQINDYNKSIDGKIDGAIASYLAGIKLTTSKIIDNYVDKLGVQIKFGDIQFVETSKKYKWGMTIGCGMVSDGYVEIDYSKMGFVQFKGSGSGTGPLGTAANNKGQYNWVEENDGKYYLTKSTLDTYFEHSYVFTGSAYCNLTSGTTLNLSTGGGAKNLTWASAFRVNQQADYNSYAQGRKYFTGKSTTWPGEYGDIWVARSDKFNEGTRTDFKIYSQAFALADDNAKNEMVLEEKNISDHLGTLNEVAVTVNTARTLFQSHNNYLCNFQGNIACHYPKMVTHDLTDLYHYYSYNKLEENLKLYEGLKFIEPTDNGTVDFDVQFSQESDVADVDLYIRENAKFENTNSNTGSSITGYYYIDGDATKHEFTDGHIVAPVDKKVSVTMEVKKNKKYFVKMVPSTATEFVSMDFLSDINMKIDA